MMPSRVSAPTPYTHFPLEELSNFPPTLGKNLIFKPVFPRFPIFWRVRCAQALASPRDLEGTRGCAKIVRTVWQSLVRIRPMAARLVTKPFFCGSVLLDFWPSHGTWQKKDSRRQPLANLVNDSLVIRIGCNTTMTCLFFEVSHRVARFRQAERVWRV